MILSLIQLVKRYPVTVRYFSPFPTLLFFLRISVLPAAVARWRPLNLSKALWAAYNFDSITSNLSYQPLPVQTWLPYGLHNKGLEQDPGPLVRSFLYKCSTSLAEELFENFRTSMKYFQKIKTFVNQTLCSEFTAKTPVSDAKASSLKKTFLTRLIMM